MQEQQKQDEQMNMPLLPNEESKNDRKAIPEKNEKKRELKDVLKQMKMINPKINTNIKTTKTGDNDANVPPVGKNNNFGAIGGLGFMNQDDSILDREFNADMAKTISNNYFKTMTLQRQKQQTADQTLDSFEQLVQDDNPNRRGSSKPRGGRSVRGKKKKKGRKWKDAGDSCEEEVSDVNEASM